MDRIDKLLSTGDFYAILDEFPEIKEKIAEIAIKIFQRNERRRRNRRRRANALARGSPAIEEEEESDEEPLNYRLVIRIRDPTEGAALEVPLTMRRVQPADSPEPPSNLHIQGRNLSLDFDIGTRPSSK